MSPTKGSHFSRLNWNLDLLVFEEGVEIKYVQKKLKKFMHAHLLCVPNFHERN